MPLLAGTDTGLPTAALGIIGYGATLHAELELLVEAGLSPTQALAAATSAPARAFRLTDRGLKIRLSKQISAAARRYRTQQPLLPRYSKPAPTRSVSQLV